MKMTHSLICFQGDQYDKDITLSYLMFYGNNYRHEVKTTPFLLCTKDTAALKQAKFLNKTITQRGVFKLVEGDDMSKTLDTKTLNEDCFYELGAEETNLAHPFCENKQRESTNFFKSNTHLYLPVNAPFVLFKTAVATTFPTTRKTNEGIYRLTAVGYTTYNIGYVFRTVFHTKEKDFIELSTGEKNAGNYLTNRTQKFMITLDPENFNICLPFSLKSYAGQPMNPVPEGNSYISPDIEACVMQKRKMMIDAETPVQDDTDNNVIVTKNCFVLYTLFTKKDGRGF